MTAAIVVLAKRPVAGQVKTRLVPPLCHDDAAALAAAALRDTLRVVNRMRVRRRILSFAGSPEGWLWPGWWHHRQPEGGLDTRMVAAIADAGSGPTVLVGMDTPQLQAAQLEAFDHSRYDACLGLASDGGYWAIGLRDPALAFVTIAGVPMSTPHTGAEQLRRLRAHGLRVQLLDELCDVDTIDVAIDVARLAPHSDFARTFRALPQTVG
ncbi:MAG: DUF2064 domain-containing protein [Actinomycetota bacterium]|nr:DUF2064 domain-containing protein [Actinomycetota bacterium]